MQRLLDFCIAGAVLLVLTPFLIPVMLILRFTGEGEVFFVQQRVGQNGQMFGLLKFATMLKDSPSLGTGTVTLKDDPRVLPVGRFLRDTKLNELPQMINVLKGDMSLVGPRPQTQRCFDAFAHDAQVEIVKVRPGLSGVGSIVFRAEEALLDARDDPGTFYDEAIMPYKGAIEQWYVANRGITLYFSVVVLTLWVVIRPNSSAVWRVLSDLPAPPAELRAALNYNHL